MTEKPSIPFQEAKDKIVKRRQQELEQKVKIAAKVLGIPEEQINDLIVQSHQEF